MIPTFQFTYPCKTCAECDKLKVQIQHAKNEGKRNKLIAQKDAHLKDVENVKRLFDSDKERADDDYFVYTFDLQKVLILPVLTTSVAYYKQKFNLYNLGVHPFPNNQDMSMFIWSEIEGAKGPEEISSCLVKFLKDHASSASHIVSYSDRAGGQNRNIKIILASKNSFITLKGGASSYIISSKLLRNSSISYSNSE